MSEHRDHSDRWALIGVGLFVAFGIIMLLSMTKPAKPHDHGFGSWIGKERISDPVTGEWCCNANDCDEELGGVEAVEGGYLVKATGEVIAPERVIWRSPGSWWRCRYLGGEKVGKTRCLIGPPPAT